MSFITNQPLTVSYFIADIAGAVATFNRIRWYRSRAGQNGLYEAATAAAAAPAELLGTTLEPHELNGKTLNLRVDGSTDYSITFAAADPFTTADAVAEILAVTSALLTPSDESGALKLTTVNTGSAASIEILEDSDAAPYLGLAADACAVGLDIDTPLIPGTHQYFLTDGNSGYDYWYRVELLHSITGDTSELSAPIPMQQVAGVPASQTIVGYIQLASATARPDVGRRVVFSNLTQPNTVLSGAVGIMKQYEEIETDATGYAQIRLLRGITIDFNIVGTGFTRRITVPSTGDAFNLLDPTLVADDEFGIQEPDIDFAIRTS